MSAARRAFRGLGRTDGEYPRTGSVRSGILHSIFQHGMTYIWDSPAGLKLRAEIACSSIEQWDGLTND